MAIRTNTYLITHKLQLLYLKGMSFPDEPAISATVSYPTGSGYPVPWTASFDLPWSLDSGNPCQNDGSDYGSLDFAEACG